MDLELGVWYTFENDKFQKVDLKDFLKPRSMKLYELADAYVKHKKTLAEYNKQTQPISTPILKPLFFHRQIAMGNICPCGKETSNDCYKCNDCCVCTKTVSKRKNNAGDAIITAKKQKN